MQPYRNILLLTLFQAMIGCQHAPQYHGPYRTEGDVHRDSLRAQELTMQAAAIMSDDPSGAEGLLREALAADLYHGPAHNNLGVIHLDRGELYEAASEFEWARKLMPGHPDPRINLALTLERARRVDDAMANYESALEVYPQHIAAMQGLARLQRRYDREDDRTLHFLSEIAMRGENEQWREWARRELSKLH